MSHTHLLPIYALVIILIGCQAPAPNTTKSGKNVLKVHEVLTEPVNMDIRDTVYVPIYSEIYDNTPTMTILLTATVSIRNTSPTHKMYIEGLEYYNSDGDLVRSYIEKTIVLQPLQTIDYVIERDDVAGGPGANFLVHWGASHGISKPYFQGVMISTAGQHGISFTTEGVSISDKL